MPRKEINNYIFYKIVCDDCPEYIYIGSTCNFTKRKSSHKSKCNNPNDRHYNTKIYMHIRENGGWDNWRMMVIDEAKQLSLRESQAHEEKLRLTYEGNLNTNRAFVTEEQNKERIKVNMAEYYEANKDTIKEKRAVYYEANKDTIKEKKAVYCEANKDTIKEKKAVYYEANKDTIKEKKAAYRVAHNKKITCECGCVIGRLDKSKHLKTQRHANLVKGQST